MCIFGQEKYHYILEDIPFWIMKMQKLKIFNFAHRLLLQLVKTIFGILLFGARSSSTRFGGTALAFLSWSGSYGPMTPRERHHWTRYAGTWRAMGSWQLASLA